jgi:hypothetical protein
MNGCGFNTKAFLDRIYRIDWISLLSSAVAGSTSQEPIACGEKKRTICDDSLPACLFSAEWPIECFRFHPESANKQNNPEYPVDPV